MSTLEVKELSHPSGEVIKIAAGKTLDLKSQGTTTLPTGSVIQVVNQRLSTQIDSTSSTYADIGLSASITPSSTSSKILVTFNGRYMLSGVVNRVRGGLQLLRGSTVIQGGNQEQLHVRHLADTASEVNDMVSTSILDSPASTASVTYKIQSSAIGSTRIRIYSSENETSITLMEIQG